MSTAHVPSWWAALSHGGLLIAPSRLVEHFPDTPPRLERYAEDRLRSALDRFESKPKAHFVDLLDATLEGAIGLGRKGRTETGLWVKGPDLSTDYSHPDASGVTVKPRRVWKGSHGAELAVFDDDATRIGVHRGRRRHAQVVEWLRATGRHLALLTNGRQWRIVHAGLEADAWAESDASLWFEEGREGDALLALRTLLSPDALTPAKAGEPGRLLRAIDDSRKGQSELSAALGENVRTAVERLIVAHGPALAELVQADPPAGGRPARTKDVYNAACRVMMRVVVLLFAEARESLLPVDRPQYRDAYSLAGLRDALERAAGSSAKGRMRERTSAWPRLLGLFRLVHGGSGHGELPIQRYGGGLFEPGDAASPDPIRRAIHVFEFACFGEGVRVSDQDVFAILRLLTRCKVKVRQGRSNKNVVAPVDFSDLSSEYIGILYEGLLDFELKRVEGEHPVIFLGLGDQPALALDRLEALEDAQVKQLVEKLGKPAKASSDEDDGGDEEASEEIDEEEVEAQASDSSDDSGDEDADAEDEDAEAPDDLRAEASDRAQQWARKAVELGKLVRKSSSRDPAKQREREEKVAAFAERLVDRTILPGEWYLVRYGGTRKGSGTYYTKPQLAIPTVQRTLRPLCYDPPTDASDAPDPDAPAADWTPKTPEAILALKVCDPACGSGSFPVAALRFLTDALYASLHHHGRIEPRADTSVIRLADGDPALRLEDETLPCRPDDDIFEPRLRARLRRHLVERCIHGVDLDPLAVDLCRVALWIETMDRELPFTFLDHRVKCGNALIGAWFDRFRDYPAMAWEREGGDKNHTKGVHFEKGAREKALKDKKKQVQSALRESLKRQGQLFDAQPADSAERRRKELARQVEELHAIPVHDLESREALFRTSIQPALDELRAGFDAWCALWFWPTDKACLAPDADVGGRGEDEHLALVRRLREELRFFHWELEFPDVFQGPTTGFDAIVGNPPWEIQKVNSKEFFSNHDPMYRALGKQDALRRQQELFDTDAEIERDWLGTNAFYKALSNWVKHVGSPFGDPNEGGTMFSFGSRKRGGNEELHDIWRGRRAGGQGFSDPEHPFRRQGGGDINSYKLFLEQSHSLLSSADGGRLGMVVPAGIYTDKGTTELRTLFLDECSWEWIFGFRNTKRIFDVSTLLKFCVIVVEKGGDSEGVRSAFMRVDLGEWADNAPKLHVYRKGQLDRFSPRSRAFLEVSDERDLEILEKIYSNSVLLGDDSENGWGVEYRTEFHMTNDSKLFPPRPKWEAKGYEPDEYSRWLKTAWHHRTKDSAAPPDAARHELEPGVILSRDGQRWTTVEEIGDVALPLYQGLMLWHWDPRASLHIAGRGHQAEWESQEWPSTNLTPQYLMSRDSYRDTEGAATGVRLAFRAVSNATNRRTFVSALVPELPSGNSIALLDGSSQALCTLNTWMGTLAFDWVVRLRMAGPNLNWFLVEELPALRGTSDSLLRTALSLNVVGPYFASTLSSLQRDSASSLPAMNRLAITPCERLRLKCSIDAIALCMAGLSEEDVRHVLGECDHPDPEALRSDLDPKGFWRVDKSVDPELRHTVLAQVAFADLQSDISTESGDLDRGIERFLTRNDGEGWMLPDTLRLADYDLGHDDRAKHPQPVASRLGPRFLEQQLAQSPEDAWRECELHAKNLAMEAPPVRA